MIGETVTRVRPGEKTDRYGATIADWDDADEEAITGCAFAPEASSEDHAGGRQAVLAPATLYAPTGADIQPQDRIVVRGETFEVDGDRSDWRNPYSGHRPGISVALRRVTG